MVMTSFHCYIMIGLSATASAATATAAATTHTATAATHATA